MSAANLSSASRIIVSITGKRLVQCPRGELDLGGVDTSLARPTEDGTPPTGPTTDHMSRTACLDGKMSTATIRRANADDTEVLGIIGPAAYADAYGYLWDRPDAYSDQLRTFGPQAFESLLARPEARVWISEARGTIVGFLSMIVGSVDPIERRPGGAEIPRIYIIGPAQRTGQSTKEVSLVPVIRGSVHTAEMPR